jgi:hypothetical protein
MDEAKIYGDDEALGITFGDIEITLCYYRGDVAIRHKKLDHPTNAAKRRPPKAEIGQRGWTGALIIRQDQKMMNCDDELITCSECGASKDVIEERRLCVACARKYDWGNEDD